ncbi:MAG: putative peptidyl-prolyl cis-trans isomerase Cbf2 precursor [Firmicutes bacterium ADurb.Bin456]|nr:MAG: putative peptidyl-prolyl cis-trans isomerase Cbf2 precursor [Firmicutes bacterium ADurb.Bin456]
MRNSFKAAFPILLALLIILLTAGCGGPGNREIVATVNGEKIFSDDLDKVVNKLKDLYVKQGADFSGDKGASLLESLRKDTLEQMINNRLMSQEGRKLGDLTAEQIQGTIQPFKGQFPSEEQYQDFLAQTGVSEEDAAYILNLQRTLTGEVPVATEEEVRRYYEENKDMMSSPQRLQVRHILFFINEGDKGFPYRHTEAEARALAEEAITELKQGRDFAGLAREKSEDNGTRADGGLFIFAEGEAVEAFAQASQALKDGEITPAPVKTEYGYHVIKREQIIPAGVEPFEKVRAQLTERLTSEAGERRFSEFMMETKSKADIYNKLAGKEGNTAN